MALYLITGVAGFIGSSLARAVLAQGDQVRGIDNLSTGKRDNIAEIENKIDFREADLAEQSPTRGCMIIKAWGMGLWERFVAEMDGRIRATGHENYYFPLLIPISFLAKEASHVEGFDVRD